MRDVVEYKRNNKRGEIYGKQLPYFLDILNERKRYYVGKWEKWFAGDRKVSVKNFMSCVLTKSPALKTIYCRKALKNAPFRHFLPAYSLLKNAGDKNAQKTVYII